MGSAGLESTSDRVLQKAGSYVSRSVEIRAARGRSAEARGKRNRLTLLESSTGLPRSTLGAADQRKTQADHPALCLALWPRATRKTALLPWACGEKKRVTSSSKKVRPVAPSRCA